jgi:RNA polymerase subunit RPABC4/transcription elongation factor Spt4
MDQIIASIGSTINDVVTNPVVRFTVQLIAIYIVIIWLAAAYWAFRDMQLRTENPILPYLASAFIIVFSPLAFLAAIVVYRIIRPQEKIGEVNERSLAEEALLAEVESVSSCPACLRRVNDEWIICPTCRTRLKRVCPNCSRLVGLDWSLCAWCGKDFERRDVVAASVGQMGGIQPSSSYVSPPPLQVPTTTRVRRTRAASQAPDPLPER